MDERDEEMMIEKIAQTLRDEPIRKPGPSFDAKVMAAIKWGDLEKPSRARAAARWFTQSRTISLSPFTGLLAAASILVVAYFGANTAVRSMISNAQPSQQVATIGNPDGTTMVSSNGTQMVQFVLVAPDAKSVSLVGDFNDWDAAATPLMSVSGNLWSVKVPLTPGRYNYIFMVDGTKLVPDPTAPKAPANGFGQPSSVVTVGSASE